MSSKLTKHNRIKKKIGHQIHRKHYITPNNLSLDLADWWNRNNHKRDTSSRGVTTFFAKSIWCHMALDHHAGKWNEAYHYDVIKWKHFPRNWPFVREIHRSPVNSPHKGQWRWALMFSLISVWINDWVNNREAGDLRRHLDHYDISVKFKSNSVVWTSTHRIKCPIVIRQIHGKSCNASTHWQTYIVARIFEPFSHCGIIDVPLRS